MAGYPGHQGHASNYYGGAPQQAPYGQQQYGAPPQQPYGNPPQQPYGAPQSHGAQQPYGQSYGSAPPPQGSGYAPAPGGQRPPPGDAELRSWFSAVDQDRSGAISVGELSSALVNGNWTPFEPSTVQMLMDMFDRDRNGTISLPEFTGLWRYIEQWQGIFKQHDRDGSGSIDPRELEGALRQFGFPLSPQTVQIVSRKFAPSNKGQHNVFAGARPVALTFDVFVRACVTVKSLTESFQRMDPQRSGWVQMSYDQFLDAALAAP